MRNYSNTTKKLLANITYIVYLKKKKLTPTSTSVLWLKFGLTWIETSIEDVAEAIAQLYVDMLRGMPGHSEGAVSIVQAAGQGDLQAVKDWVKNNPDKVKHNYCDFLFLSLSLSLSLCHCKVL